MDDAKHLEHLRGLIRELLRQARDSRGIEAAIEAASVLWAIRKIEASAELHALGDRLWEQ